MAATESQSHQLYTRLDPGSTSGKRIRYPDDDYDRIWSPWVENFWMPINTSFSINLRKDVGYQPALALQNNQSREFDFSLDGEYALGPFSPKNLSVNTIFTTSPLSGRDQHVVDLYKTASSPFPPILNAVEVFIVKQLTSPTGGQDVDAIMNIKAVYQIKRNWMGDPCLPVNYSWNGLNCSYPDSSSPTIISLDLSSSGLTGEIATSLANLTSIQSSVDNNPNLIEPSNVNVNNDINPCQVGSCKKRRKLVVPVLASVIPLLVLLTIAFFVLWKLSQRRNQRGNIAIITSVFYIFH
ncbi:hypothetical protein MRB53_012868 [Persea americana]|uniref:Uncharacterized protein n=1 Tax=Persea americana TaxID=3435 RepID=A0ACC2LZU1_PERAE|nr:hypothetical protein MRB53_012868 [Persea americana]